MPKDHLIFVRHILLAIEKIERFSKGVTKERLKNDEILESAFIRQIEIIGEASCNVPESIKRKYPQIPWKDMVGMRNILIHHYFAVDVNVLWKTMNQDLPPLKKQIKEILDAENVT